MADNIPLRKALAKYQDALHTINYMRIELARQEMDAWQELKIVLNEDNPSAMHRVFNDSTQQV